LPQIENLIQRITEIGQQGVDVCGGVTVAKSVKALKLAGASIEGAGVNGLAIVPVRRVTITKNYFYL
jgi:hypothetical protein